MDGQTTIKTGGKDVISTGSIIPYDSDEVTELFFDYGEFKLRVAMEFRDSDAKKDKNRRYYHPAWDRQEDSPPTLSLKFINAPIAYGPGGPTDAIELGTYEGKTLFLRIRLLGSSSERIVIYYTLYSVEGTE